MLTLLLNLSKTIMDKKILGFLWAMLGVVVGIVCLVGIVHC